MIFPDEWARPAVASGVLMSAVGSALVAQQIWTELRDGGYLRRAQDRWHTWRNRKLRPDTDYGLDDDATVTTFIGVLHGDETPLLHHTGEIPVSRLRTSGPVTAEVRSVRPSGYVLLAEPMPVVVELDLEDTEPMIPEGVHGFRIGRRPIQMTLIRSESRTGEQVAIAQESTPIFDALGAVPVLDLDVTFDWDRVEIRELVGVG